MQTVKFRMPLAPLTKRKIRPILTTRTTRSKVGEKNTLNKEIRN